jgi:glycine hydroxymethyltransferase
VPFADVVTLTTHKTLRGPRAGTILCRRPYAAAIDKAVFPGLQGGPLMHVIAAKAVAFLEASQPSFRQYAADVVTNAAARRRARIRRLPHRVGRHREPPDAGHLRRSASPARLRRALDAAGITCNKNAIPNDPEKPFVTSGLRLGSASVTTAGMGVGEMREIASLMARVLRAVDDAGIAAEVREQANRLCSKFTPYPES